MEGRIKHLEDLARDHDDELNRLNRELGRVEGELKALRMLFYGGVERAKFPPQTRSSAEHGKPD